MEIVIEKYEGEAICHHFHNPALTRITLVRKTPGGLIDRTIFTKMPVPQRMMRAIDPYTFDPCEVMHQAWHSVAIFKDGTQRGAAYHWFRCK